MPTTPKIPYEAAFAEFGNVVMKQFDSERHLTSKSGDAASQPPRGGQQRMTNPVPAIRQRPPNFYGQKMWTDPKPPIS